MGSILSTCHHLLQDGSIPQAGMLNNYVAKEGGPQLRLRVVWNPIRETAAAVLSPFRLTDELLVEALDVQGLRNCQLLGLRHEQYILDCQAPPGHQLGHTPGGARCSIPKFVTRAKIGDAWYLLGMAALPEDRTMSNVKIDITDSKEVADYALKFNAHLAKMDELANGGGHDGKSREEFGASSSSVPRVLVCAPIACSVVETPLPRMLGGRDNEVVSLTPYPDEDVSKFIFDGVLEEFQEVPQSFFHHAACMSGGEELLFDLQGCEREEGEFLLVDPCIWRKPKKKGIKELLSTAMADPEQAEVGDLGVEDRFGRLHRYCGPLCKTFDPDRRGPRAHRVCGLDTNCGL
mmetsp:Transcript_125452/g.250365  ORF Transcript_125452/g.250365 Transcript_125452/m.250365 type:complete len:348 (+) Transcript_125452:70-1113(+)